MHAPLRSSHSSQSFSPSSSVRTASSSFSFAALHFNGSRATTSGAPASSSAWGSSARSLQSLSACSSRCAQPSTPLGSFVAVSALLTCLSAFIVRRAGDQRIRITPLDNLSCAQSKRRSAGVDVRLPAAYAESLRPHLYLWRPPSLAVHSSWIHCLRPLSSSPAAPTSFARQRPSASASASLSSAPRCSAITSPRTTLPILLLPILTLNEGIHTYLVVVCYIPALSVVLLGHPRLVRLARSGSRSLS